MRILRSAFFIFVLLAAASAQQQSEQKQAKKPGPPASGAAAEPMYQELVKAQFGPNFRLLNFDALTGDLDSDGVQDLVLIATARDVLSEQLDFHYTVADPYDGYYGFEDPAVTQQFNVHNADNLKHMLVVFGAGAEGWKAEQPKSKWVLLNVPFDKLSLGKVLVKKKTYPAIKAEETRVAVSSLYFDVKKKKWKWEPGTDILDD